MENELCPHIKKFYPDILVLPHSGYYLSEKFLQNVFKFNPKIKIILVCHIFDPSKKSGVVESKVPKASITFEEDDNNLYNFDEEDIKRGIDKLSKKKLGKVQMENKIVASWERKSDKIIFKVHDDKTYNHPDLLPIMYNESLIENDEGQTKVLFRIHHKNMDHVAMLLQGSYVSYKTSYNGTEPVVLTRCTKFHTAYDVVNNGEISFMKSDNDNIILLNKVDQKARIITFSLGELSTKFKIKFEKIIDYLCGVDIEHEDIMSAHYYDFLTAFHIEVPNHEVYLEATLYNSLVNYGRNVNFYDLECVENFKGIIAGIFDKYTSPYTINTIAYNILKDVMFSRILTSEMLQSNYLRLFKQSFRVGRELTLIEKILSLLTKRKIDSKFRLLKEEVKIDFQKRTISSEEALKIAKRAELIQESNIEFKPTENTPGIKSSKLAITFYGSKYNLHVNEIEQRNVALYHFCGNLEKTLKKYLFYRMLRGMLYVKKIQLVHIPEPDNNDVNDKKGLDNNSDDDDEEGEEEEDSFTEDGVSYKWESRVRGLQREIELLWRSVNVNKHSRYFTANLIVKKMEAQGASFNETVEYLKEFEQYTGFYGPSSVQIGKKDRKDYTGANCIDKNTVKKVSESIEYFRRNTEPIKNKAYFKGLPKLQICKANDLLVSDRYPIGNPKNVFDCGQIKKELQPLKQDPLVFKEIVQAMVQENPTPGKKKRKPYKKNKKSGNWNYHSSKKNYNGNSHYNYY